MPRNNRNYQSRHIRNRTGLRNKRRSSRSTYSARAARGDFYGKWDNGKQVTPDRIAGSILVIKERTTI